MPKVKKNQSESRVYRVVSTFLSDIYESSVWQFATVILVASLSMLSWYFSVGDILTAQTKKLNDKKQERDELEVANDYLKRNQEIVQRFSSGIQREADTMNDLVSRSGGGLRVDDIANSLLGTYQEEVNLKNDVKKLTAEMKGLKFYSSHAELLSSEISMDIDSYDIFLTHLDYVEKELGALKSHDINSYFAVHKEDIAALPGLGDRIKTNVQAEKSLGMALEALLTQMTAEADAVQRDADMLNLKILGFHLAQIYTGLYFLFALIKLQKTWVATK
jgi:hypothetical protein